MDWTAHARPLGSMLEAVGRTPLVHLPRIEPAGHELWDALPEIDETAEQEFVWETIDHYEEHLADLRRFAGAGV